MAMSSTSPLVLRPLAAASGLLRGSSLLFDIKTSLANVESTGARSFGSKSGKMDSLFISDTNVNGHRTPLIVGLMNYFERHLPNVGYFQPIYGKPAPCSELKLDKNTELVHKTFKMSDDPQGMRGVQDTEAARLIAAGKTEELMDRIYSAYMSYKEGKDLVLVDGPGSSLGDVELDSQIAATLGSPVLLALHGVANATADDYFSQALLRRQTFVDHKVDVLGAVVNGLPRSQHAILSSQLKEKLDKAGLPFAGALPEDSILSSVRLDEVRSALSAERLYGDSLLTDVEFDDVVVGSQRLEELLEILGERPGSRPLVVTSADRLDIVLGLLSAQLSVRGPSVAGILLTQAGTQRAGRNYAKAQVDLIFAGLAQGGQYQGSLLPVLSTDAPMKEALATIARLHPTILPTSTQKIAKCKALSEKHLDVDAVVAGLQRPRPTRMTPKMFQHNIKTMCTRDPQRIVLPETKDKRILAAAAEIMQRGLARVTLLGSAETVANEAKKLGLDLSGCDVVDPTHSERFEHYVDMLVEARKKKGMTREAAKDLLLGDINFFGTLMVAAGDADGMVSGAMHTTAATIRPALQLLKSSGFGPVSSVFFMCLPDRVLVYGDCAVVVNPTPEELATIAITSADTAAGFGIEPRVAMLSYSTLGSGAGPDVQKVTDAVAIVRQKRPDLKVEGPIQYDAAIDPEIAATKIKGGSAVAGKANVFVFPDLNTGNNCYKAVQQSTGAIAMGPVMQGLQKPVNDLSRGCTVADIVNTVCVTSIQAMQVKAAAAKKASA